MLSLALYAVEFRGGLAAWYTLVVASGAIAPTVPLVSAAATAMRTAGLRSSVPGEAGDMFDDLPAALPRRPWALCIGLAMLVGVLALIVGGLDEGPRNAVVEAALVIACFAALGRRLGLRR